MRHRQPCKGKLISKSQKFMHTDKMFQWARLEIVSPLGNSFPSQPTESDPKDTVITHFDHKGLYIWHCHLLSHEKYSPTD
ncbi:hypothetical protein GCM10027180_24550 [Microbulbifer echini]